MYKTINLINNKIYIGVHVTNDINDSYMGSGKLLKAAIKKYGIENFKREILYTFQNPEEMFNKEKEIVNEEFIKRDDVYNIKLGGNGGWYNLNYGEQKHLNKRFNSEYQSKISGVKKFTKNQRRQYSKKGIEKLLEMIDENGGIWWKSVGFLGKSHSKETKAIMSKKKQGLYEGKNNPSYGSCWIYNSTLKECKKIDKKDSAEWIRIGWKLGRKMKF